MQRYVVVYQKYLTLLGEMIILPTELDTGIFDIRQHYGMYSLCIIRELYYNHSKVMANVKWIFFFFWENRQTGQNTICPNLLIRGHKKISAPSMLIKTSQKLRIMAGQHPMGSCMLYGFCFVWYKLMRMYKNDFLTHSHTPWKQAFWKHCGKRRNCS